MLQYNYSTSLSHFLSYHQLEDQTVIENDHSTPSLCEDLSQEEDPRCRSNSSASNNKSFTIAAILGLNNNGDSDIVHSPQDHSHTVMNLSSRLQLPVNRTGPTIPTGHFPSIVVGHGCSQAARQTVRSLKHLPTSSMAGKKGCKSKRVRTIFTPEQLERLEAEFERQQYMVGPERLYLAHTLQLTEAQVKVWFQNRRIKWRKHHLELTHQRLAVLKQQQMLMEETSHAEGQEAIDAETCS